MERKQITKELIKEMERLHSEGKSVMEIAFEMKISFYTIKYHLEEKYRDGIKSRQRELYKNKPRRKNG